MDMKPDLSKGKSLGSRLLEKMLMPIVATASGAAATYAAKKGPQLLDEKIAPRVRELMNGRGSGSEEPAAEADSTAGDAGDVAESLNDRARSAAGSTTESARSAGNSSARSAGNSNGHRAKRISNEELERRLRERAEARKQRRASGK
jgi:hypothetical protein